MHDLSSFSGFFGDSEEFESFDALGIGVAKEPKEGFFVAVASSFQGRSKFYRIFADLQTMANQWFQFLSESTLPGVKPVICAEIDFLKLLYRNEKLEPLIDVETVQFKPIANDMARAYLNVLLGRNPNSLEVATFLASVACDPLTYQFLTLTGMAHSAQDIIKFLTRRKWLEMQGIENISRTLRYDLVSAGFPGGVELFTLERTDETPEEVDPANLGIDYFSIVSRNKHLFEPYKVKLAVIAVCKKYHIKLGYQVIWQASEGMPLYTKEVRNHQNFKRD